MVRTLPVSDDNPFLFDVIARNIYSRFAGEKVKVIAIPDIESINYGRDVGYEVNEWIPPDDIREISGTNIRTGSPCS